MTKYFSIQYLEKSFTDNDGKSKKILENMSLDLDKGSLTLLKGRSGSGKSTLLNIISGMLLPDSGTVTIDSVVVSNLSESKRDLFRANKVGYIFQTFNLISALTCIENIYMPSVLSATCNTKAYKTAAYDILKEMQIEEHAHKYPYQLSVGQRQRVAIGRTLFKEPDIILADEPTASLDKGSAEIVIKSLLNLKGKGKTLIIATHDPIFDSLSPDLIYNIEKKEVIA